MSREPVQVNEASVGHMATTEEQNVSLGYKRTDVGMIPVEWEVKSLPEICWFQEGPGLRNWQFRTSGIKVINVTNLENSILNLDSTDRHISLSEFHRMYQHFAVDAGDIVMASSGNSYSKTAVVRSQDLPLMMNTSVIRFKPVGKTIYGFLWAFLNSPLFKSQIDLMITGGAQPNFGPYHLRRVLVPVPEFDEQRAIAEALSDVDGLIEALEKLIAKKRAIKQAAMQQLLTGKTRLPGFSGKWRERPLADLAVITMGQSPQSKFYNGRGDGLPLIQGNADIENRRSIDRVWTTQASKRCDAGDLLLTVRAPVGAVGIATRDACLGRGVCGLKPLSNAAFLFQALVYAEPRWKVLEQGSTFTSANSKQVGQFILTAPDEHEEQAAIATVLADIDAKIEALERRRDKTKQIKQGMMQQLLTGRIRLVKPEAHAPADQFHADTKDGKTHSWAFNEAVVIATLTKNFGSEQFPLGRKRYTKLSYLLKRHAKEPVSDYLKKAAGPYNPKTRYGGPERIALENSYVHEHKRGPYSGFVVADNIAEAESYFRRWYGSDVIQWLERFRRKTNDELELLTTVDMAVEELRTTGKSVDVVAVKDVIRSHPEWKNKLERPIFSDANIAGAIEMSRKLFKEKSEH